MAACIDSAGRIENKNGGPLHFFHTTSTLLPLNESVNGTLSNWTALEPVLSRFHEIMAGFHPNSTPVHPFP